MAVHEQQASPKHDLAPTFPTDSARAQPGSNYSFQLAGPAERTRALSLLTSGYTTRGRIAFFGWAREVYQANPSAFDLLYVAEQSGKTRGVVWGRAAAGRIIICLGPALAEGESETTRSALLGQLDRSIARSDAQVAFATAAPGRHGESTALAANGFCYITDIAQLACVLRGGSEPMADDKLNFEPYSPTEAERLKAILRRSREQSLDCTRLHGVRQTDDVLDGLYYREGLEPSHWRIVRHGRQDVGCLLLSRSTRRAEAEVVYVSLVPEARGRGWGGRLVQHAKRLSRSAGAERLMLTCDVTNPPALLTYRRAGFRETNRWSTFFKDYSKRAMAGVASDQFDATVRRGNASLQA